MPGMMCSVVYAIRGGVVPSWLLGGESPLRALVMGIVSRTARVSVVRRNLKEAVRKVPARGTRSAYEAAPSGRGGQKTRSPIVTREDGDVDATGMWDEGGMSYPGRPLLLPWCYCHRKMAGWERRSQQRPYEPVSPTGKGPNLSGGSRPLF